MYVIFLNEGYFIDTILFLSRVSTPFIYRPRTHPRQPIVTTSFLSSVKSLPEEWFQAQTKTGYQSESWVAERQCKSKSISLTYININNLDTNM